MEEEEEEEEGRDFPSFKGFGEPGSSISAHPSFIKHGTYPAVREICTIATLSTHSLKLTGKNTYRGNTF